MQVPGDGRGDLEGAEECEEDAEQDVETPDNEGSHSRAGSQ